MRLQTRFGIALLVLAVGSLPAAEDQQPWRVLVLHTGDFYMPASVAQDQAMRSALTGSSPRPVEFHGEALDVGILDNPDIERELLALLVRKRQRGLPIDLIMPLGGEALAFAQRHRAELWPGVPIVFFSVAPATIRGRELGPGVTGVTVDTDEAGTLDLALRLQRATRRVVLIAGASEYDRSWVPRLEAVVRQRADRVDATFLVGQTLPSLLDAVARLPPDTIVLYTSVLRDGAGRPYLSRDVLEQLVHASTAPVYGVSESYLGHGVVGGSMFGFEAHGRRAGELALRVLRGEKAETIPVQAPARAVPMVDWWQLRRWDLSERSLPPGALVLFRPRSFWDQYRWYVIAASLALAIQAGLIVALLLQRRRARLAESEARRQQVELAHGSRLAAVGALTAMIAHEINQPLGAILGNAEAAEMLLESNPRDLQPVRQMLADIQHENHRASEVIRHVRALLSRAPLEMRPVALNDVIHDVLEMVAPDAERRGIVIDAKLAAGLPAVNGDAVYIQQMLFNLILNGLEALSPAGQADRRIAVTTGLDGARGVELTVADNGPGIPPKYLPRLFDSFFTSKKEGMGLGLAIVRSVVEAHSGRIKAENNPDRGATFRVSLPVADPGNDPARAV